jgi:hypothetical protein
MYTVQHRNTEAQGGGDTVATNNQRILVTMQPEWVEKLDELKRTVFYNEPKAAMVRYIMERGMQAIEAENSTTA